MKRSFGRDGEREREREGDTHTHTHTHTHTQIQRAGVKQAEKKGGQRVCRLDISQKLPTWSFVKL